MIEKFTNIWNEPDLDVICITTNGTVKSDGTNIMGGGIARQAVDRVPWLPGKYGKLLAHNPLTLQYLEVFDRYYSTDISLPSGKACTKSTMLLAFPTKVQIYLNADIKLIQQSFSQLITFMEIFPFYKVGLPRPGSGLGGLKWETVKPVLEYMLQNRFDDRLTIYGYSTES